MIGFVLTILAFCGGYYGAALIRQKEIQQQAALDKKLRENLGYLKDTAYPVVFITQEHYNKYDYSLKNNVIYVITDDYKKETWTLG